MKIMRDQIYLVDHEIRGVFYMKVKQTDETFTVGEINRRKGDKLESNSLVTDNNLIKIRNSLSVFNLINKEEAKKIKRKDGVSMLKVKFEIEGKYKVVDIPEICKARDGFWIDSSGSFTQDNSAELFIMPHMIKEVKKINEEGFEHYKSEEAGK